MQTLITARREAGYLPIEDYGAIGDGRALALVGLDGSIDWLCLPELDSPSIFGALLDPVRGGRFELAPAIPYEVKRGYLRDSNVLETEYHTDQGTVQVTDALTLEPAADMPWRELGRLITGMSGTVPMRWRVHPRFEYGRRSVRPERCRDTLVYRHAGLALRLAAWDAGEPRVSDDAVEGRFEISAGSRALLALLASAETVLPRPTRAVIEQRLLSTVAVWREWLSRCRYDGPWTAAVRRSLLAIRLLTDGRTGAIAAAGTTSLPEALGAERNYDYRYAWVRDLSFTVEALLRVGMGDLAGRSVNWLLDAVARTGPRVAPVYRLSGEPLREQDDLPLPGYRRTRPVHVGNQAGSQLQLGGWGDLVETVHQFATHGHLIDPAAGERLADSVDLLASIWAREDAGLWELGSSAHYATSKLGCWTAFDRLLELVAVGQAPARHVGRWEAARRAVREFIETELWSEQRGSYLMRTGSDALDCGVLLAARRGFADPRGPRMRGTIDAIRGELHAGGPLFYRYSGMQEEENAFLACSFWMVEALAQAGRIDEAAELMDGAVALGSDLGLFSEEMEPGSRAMRGNLPQALTHLALVSAAAIFAEATGSEAAQAARESACAPRG